METQVIQILDRGRNKTNKKQQQIRNQETNQLTKKRIAKETKIIINEEIEEKIGSNQYLKEIKEWIKDLIDSFNKRINKLEEKIEELTTCNK